MMSQQRSRPLTFVVYAKRQESRVISCLDFHIVFGRAHTLIGALSVVSGLLDVTSECVVDAALRFFLPLARRAHSTFLLRELQRPVIAPNIRKRSVFWVEVCIYARVVPGGVAVHSPW